ncbi:hypothetical protein [Demequina aurantiaca]|uniref:hypothetical protein n=1 Tax=Demequina aurantiaca TaxID=676200 RepID=UPI003D33E3CA
MSVIVEEQFTVDVRPCAAGQDLAWAGQAGLAPWFDPARIAPPNTCAPVFYDAFKVRQIIGGLGLRSQALQDPSTVRHLWHPSGARRGFAGTAAQRYVETDVALDADVLTFASTAIDPRNAYRLVEPSGVSEQVVSSRTRFVHAASAQGLALALSLSAGGSFAARVGHLRPDDTIDCVIERAFVLAATAIHVGVDHLVARTWANAIIVSHGLPRPLMTLGVDRALHDGEWFYPKRTRLTEHYLQSLEDLDGGDATRFIVLAARCAVGTQTSVSGMPGT